MATPQHGIELEEDLVVTEALSKSRSCNEYCGQDWLTVEARLRWAGYYTTGKKITQRGTEFRMTHHSGAVIGGAYYFLCRHRDFPYGQED